MPTFVALPLAAGGFAPVNPEYVDAITDVPAALTNNPPNCFVSFVAESGLSRITALGTAAAIAALLTTPAPPPVTVSFGGYAPPGTAVSGPLGLISGQTANWHQIGNVVALAARFVVSTTSVGTASFSFPPPVQAPLQFQTRGACTATNQPYTPGPPDSIAIVDELGPDFLVTFGANGGTTLVDVVLLYVTP